MQEIYKQSFLDAVPKYQYKPEYLEVKRPTRKDIENSAILYVKFGLVYESPQMPHIKDIESLKAHARAGHFKIWSQIDGLRSKIFFLDPENNTCGGIYTFFTKQDLLDYMKTPLFQAMDKFPCAKDITWEIHENLAGGERCAEQGCWPVSKGRGPV